MKRHPLRELAVFPLKAYKKYVSPATPASCRYLPTCSEYAMEAIMRFGIIPGWIMAICRLLRCNPLCKGGLDPVPDHFTLRPYAGVKKTANDKETSDKKEL